MAGPYLWLTAGCDSSHRTMRSFHSSAARAIKPVFKPHSSRQGVRSFEDNFRLGANERPTQKIWEKRGISKDEFFGHKYSRMSAEDRQKIDDKTARQKAIRKRRKLDERREQPSRFRPDSIRNPLSEYIFGTHPVLAALLAGKREAFSTLYMHNEKSRSKEILALAKKYGVRVVEKDSKGDLNVLLDNGVHNGVVLETRPLVFPYISSLDGYSEGQYEVTTRDEYTDELVKETHPVVRRNSPKYPLGILVDGITDPFNLGNIIRSAHFLGADFMIIPESESARLGPVTAKASVGALDLFKIYKTSQPMHFVEEAKRKRWNVVSTGTKPSAEGLAELKARHREHVKQKYIEASDLPTLMNGAPMLLIMGSEGSGVRANLQLRSDYVVGLQKGNMDDDLVDSLNVGVAAALMISKCFE